MCLTITKTFSAQNNSHKDQKNNRDSWSYRMEVQTEKASQWASKKAGHFPFNMLLASSFTLNTEEQTHFPLVKVV